MYLYLQSPSTFDPPDSEHLLRAAIPTEPAAIFVYVLLLAAVWAVWKGSSSSSPASRDPGAQRTADRAEDEPPDDPRRPRRE